LLLHTSGGNSMKALGSFMHRAEETYRPSTTKSTIKLPGWRRSLSFLCVLLIIVCVLGVVFLWYSGVNAIEETQVQHFAIHHRANVIVTNDFGNVHIHSGLVDEVVVQSTRHEIGVQPNLGDLGVTTSASGDGDTVTVNTQNKINSSNSNISSYGIDLDITVPAVANFTIESRNGDVDIDDIKGMMNVQVQNGSINAQNIRGEGLITFRSINGAIDVDRMSGAVSFMTAGNGHIEAVETTISGRSTFTSKSGDINIDGDIESDCHCSFSSGSGSIDITLPSLSSFDLQTSTVNGIVDNEFDSSQVGSQPRARIHVRTVSGNITINDVDY
jgi:hypothetical protein